jgi:NTE family protein
VPFLRGAGLVPGLFIGTSAGAINATLFAAGAHLPADEQAAAALSVWRERGDRRRPPAVVAERSRHGRALGRQLCPIPGVRLTSLVDTGPLAWTACRLVDWAQLAAHLDGGKASLAVVTTSAANNRTVVFVDGNRAARYRPRTPPDRSTTSMCGSPPSTSLHPPRFRPYFPRSMYPLPTLRAGGTQTAGYG